MDISFISDIKEVLSIQGGMYIYGARTIAQRLQLYLSSHNKYIDGFLVSKRYINPDFINGIKVYRIEMIECEHIDNVILAISDVRAFWSISEILEKMSVQNFFVLRPDTFDSFPLDAILTKNCQIDSECIISDSAQIFADETSSVTIGKHVIINDDVNIFAVDHSSIVINDETTVNAKTHIDCEQNSILSIGEYCNIGYNTQISSIKGSEVDIGTSCDIIGGCISALNNSCIDIGNDVISGVSSFITENHGNISVGDKSTFGSENWLGAVNDIISIGTDCMFSSHIQMIIGSHVIYDMKSGENITHRNGVHIGNHVWIGLKTTIVDGSSLCDGSVVGAGSTVTKVVPANVTCAGNPVRILHKDIRWERK